MTGIIVLTVLALALIAALEGSHRRHAAGFSEGRRGSSGADDRDLARTKLDLLALGGAAEPFSYKPMRSATTVSIGSARLHYRPSHGRHAA